MDTAHATALVAVLGATISPYLFVWQSSTEVGKDYDTARCLTPNEAPAQFSRIRIDTIAGMSISNLIAIFIIYGGAATLQVKALYQSAVANGILAAPVMAAIMLIAGNGRIMGRLTLPPR